MDRIWSELDKLDTFVHRKHQFNNYNANFRQIKRDEMITKQFSSISKLQATISLQIDPISTVNEISSSLELNLSSISKFQWTINHRMGSRTMSSGNRKQTRGRPNPISTHPEIPRFLAIPRFNSLWI